MSDDQILARLFGWVGGILLVAGGVLWVTVPIRPMFPPYAATSVFALGCALWCSLRARRAKSPRP